MYGLPLLQSAYRFQPTENPTIGDFLRPTTRKEYQDGQAGKRDQRRFPETAVLGAGVMGSGIYGTSGRRRSGRPPRHRAAGSGDGAERRQKARNRFARWRRQAADIEADR